MTACKVCGATGPVGRLELGSGQLIGPFCPGECTGLGWEAHFVLETGEGPYESKLIAWRWSRRLAEVEGRAFLTPPPKTEAEKALDRWVFSLGVA